MARTVYLMRLGGLCGQQINYYVFSTVTLTNKAEASLLHTYSMLCAAHGTLYIYIMIQFKFKRSRFAPGLASVVFEYHGYSSYCLIGQLKYLHRIGQLNYLHLIGQLKYLHPQCTATRIKSKTQHCVVLTNEASVDTSWLRQRE